MTDKINDGGPAFPHLGLYMSADGNLHPTATQYVGLSLRDWFAGQVIASVKGWHPADRMGKSSAEIAYDIADAMIKVREGKA